MKSRKRTILGALSAATLAVAGAFALSAPAHAATGGQGIVCDTWESGGIAYGKCTGVDPNDTMIFWDLHVSCESVSWTGRHWEGPEQTKTGVSDGSVISLGCPYIYPDMTGYWAEID